MSPKLIGIVKLPIPRIKRGDGFVDHLIHVAFDTDGQAWGLVVRQKPFPGKGSLNVSRLMPDRWVRFEAMSFSNEVVTSEEWSNAPQGAFDE